MSYVTCSWDHEFRITNQQKKLLTSKGQIISKWFFGAFDFLQKTNENKSIWGIIVVKSNSFVCFLEEIEDIKNLFEMKWPLALPETWQFVDHLTVLPHSSCQRSCWMAHIMNCTCVNCNKYSNSNNYMTLTDRVIILSNSITGAIWKSNTKYWKVKWKINKGTISNYRPGETLSNQWGLGDQASALG